MKFCIGITVYNPNGDDIKNIERYLKSKYKVFIYDNSEKVNDYLISKVSEVENTKYIRNENNGGLSVAFNCMCRKAYNEGFNYICLLDQDSIFEINDFEKISNVIIKNREKVGIFIPRVIFLGENNYNNRGEENIDFESVEWGITSGGFINLNICAKVGWFDEKYFIDRLDADYCKSVKKLGYKIIRVNKAALYQKLGDEIEGTKFRGHRPMRHYYIFRNRLYYNSKYEKNLFKRIIKDTCGSFRQIIVVLLKENNKSKKIYMMGLGMKDYFNNSMGKRVNKDDSIK